MEFEYKCRYLGEIIVFAKVVQGEWPISECEAPEDSTPSHAGSASFEDDSKKYFCRLATSDQTKCSAYKPSDIPTNVLKLNKQS
jgi:hypothetical protein